MSEQPEEQDQELLRRLVLGEVARDSREVRERAAASPPFAEAVSELLATQESLERVRSADAELIASARDQVASGDRELVAAQLASVAQVAPAAPPAPSRTRGGRLWVTLGAAAAALAIFFVLGPEDPRESGRGVEGPGITLGRDGCVRPRGVVDAYAPFVVECDLEPLWTLEIVVLDAAGDELVRSGRLETTTWEPTARQAAILERAPDIRWQFDVLDPNGDVRELGACSASRSR